MSRDAAPRAVIASASSSPAMTRTTDSRLRRRSDFARVSDIGKGRANDLVVLRYAPNDLDAMRAGYAVSKRVGGAVRRNSVKRRLREAVRKLGPREAAIDLVFIARPKIADADYQSIEKAVADVLKRAALRHGTRSELPAGQNPSPQQD